MGATLPNRSYPSILQNILARPATDLSPPHTPLVGVNITAGGVSSSTVLTTAQAHSHYEFVMRNYGVNTKLGQFISQLVS